jgi:hypothetical protein
MKVAPAKPGLIVRDPITLKPLPEEGAEVESTTYWKRRLKVGDVVAVSDKPAKVKKETAQ